LISTPGSKGLATSVLPDRRNDECGQASLSLRAGSALPGGIYTAVRHIGRPMRAVRQGCLRR
jgi:hypothetical protein